MLAQGQLLQWTEGPLWIEDDNNGYLIFSDTITNRIYRWEQGSLLFVFYQQTTLQVKTFDYDTLLLR